MEYALVRSERLATLGQLTATVAHELRNPLGSIRSSLAVIQRLTDKDSAMVVDSIEIADRGISRCNHIITDLLDFTRTKGLTRTRETFDKWLEEVLNEYEFEPGVTVSRSLEADDTEINIDKEQLRGVVVNLLDNACHAMARKSQEKAGQEELCVSVTTRRVDGWLELGIRDTGHGIPAYAMENIFEPLFTTKNFGAGLGLPIVKQTVENHGGEVQVSSEEGRGTLVTARLPW